MNAIIFHLKGGIGVYDMISKNEMKYNEIKKIQTIVFTFQNLELCVENWLSLNQQFQLYLGKGVL